jgi:hypothetical protein
MLMRDDMAHQDLGAHVRTMKSSGLLPSVRGQKSWTSRHLKWYTPALDESGRLLSFQHVRLIFQHTTGPAFRAEPLFGDAPTDEEYVGRLTGFMLGTSELFKQFIIAAHRLVAAGLLSLGCKKRKGVRELHDDDSITLR